MARQARAERRRKGPDRDGDTDLPPGDAREAGPRRRCIVTGRIASPDEMVRFVVGPDDAVVPDVAARLPGKGLWLSAARDVIETAAARNHFAKAARRPVTVPEDLPGRVEALLHRRCLDLLGLARRSGAVVAGFEKVRAALRDGRAALLLEAADGAAGGRGKLRGLAAGVPVIDDFTGADLGAAVGRDVVVHVAVAPGRLARLLQAEAARYRSARACMADGNT